MLSYKVCTRSSLYLLNEPTLNKVYVQLKRLVIVQKYQTRILKNYTAVILTLTRDVYHPHFLYRSLDSKKTSGFQFSVPGLREIHKNLKQKQKINSCEFFKASSAQARLLVITSAFTFCVAFSKVLFVCLTIVFVNPFREQKFGCFFVLQRCN